MAPVTVRGGNASLTEIAERGGQAPLGRGRLVVFCAVAAWLLATVPDAAEPKRPAAAVQVPMVPAHVPMVPAQPTSLVQTPQPAPQPEASQIPPQPQPQPGGELPQPRLLEGFRPGQSRLERLGTPGPLGTTPVPTEKDLALQRQFVEDIVDPHNVIDLVINRTRLLRTKEIPFRVQIGDENIATYALLGENEITLLGRQVNTTVLNLWFHDPKDPKKEIILSYLVRVIPDPEVKERLERSYQALQDEINSAFPDSQICLKLVGDKLVVSGQPKDIAEATQILRIVQYNAPGGPGIGAGAGQSGAPQGIPVSTIQPTSYNPSDPNAPTGLPGQSQFLLAGGPNVINLMRIPGVQQVNLRVIVAEVNRSAARSIGVNFAITNNHGITLFGQNTGNLFSNGGGAFGGGGTALGASGAGVGGGINSGFGSVVSNLAVNLDNGKIPFAISALRNLNFARSLAEPNLTTLNGQTAMFFAGGQFPVPVISGFTAAGLQGVSFIPFGVQLTFTPYVTDKDRIRLTLFASVSTRNPSLGSTGFGGSGGLGGGGNIGGLGGLGGLGGGVGGGFVSGLNSRTFSTTVEMREGQTLAIAGLLQNSFGSNATRVPFFGDLPWVGQFFSFNGTSHSEQELVVLVTPELVHPLEPKEMPPLPGADLFEPGDLEFYLLNRLESRRAIDYRSSVRTDLARMAAYRHCEDLYILGPHGQTSAPPVPAPPQAPMDPPPGAVPPGPPGGMPPGPPGAMPPSGGPMGAPMPFGPANGIPPNSGPTGAPMPADPENGGTLGMPRPLGASSGSPMPPNQPGVPTGAPMPASPPEGSMPLGMPTPLGMPPTAPMPVGQPRVPTGAPMPMGPANGGTFQGGPAGSPMSVVPPNATTPYGMPAGSPMSVAPPNGGTPYGMPVGTPGGPYLTPTALRASGQNP